MASQHRSMSSQTRKWNTEKTGSKTTNAVGHSPYPLSLYASVSTQAQGTTQSIRTIGETSGAILFPDARDGLRSRLGVKAHPWRADAARFTRPRTLLLDANWTRGAHKGSRRVRCRASARSAGEIRWRGGSQDMDVNNNPACGGAVSLSATVSFRRPSPPPPPSCSAHSGRRNSVKRRRTDFTPISCFRGTKVHVDLRLRATQLLGNAT